jgi:hypothetical protein
MNQDNQSDSPISTTTEVQSSPPVPPITPPPPTNYANVMEKAVRDTGEILVKESE